MARKIIKSFNKTLHEINFSTMNAYFHYLLC